MSRRMDYTHYSLEIVLVLVLLLCPVWQLLTLASGRVHLFLGCTNTLGNMKIKF